MQKYYVKAYNKKTAKSVEAENLVIESVYEQIKWTGTQLTKQEKEMILNQVGQFYDFEFGLRNIVVRIAKQDIRDAEKEHGIY